MTRPLIWVAVASAVGVVLLAAIVAGVAGSAPSSVTAGYGASRYASKSIPPEALALYQAAAADQGMDWAILAGIGKVETNHCRSKLPGVHSGSNGAGAQGCMQFLAGTWAIYGKGGSPYKLEDAIPAAARLLKAAGAPGDYHRAIFAYNHSPQYVSEVMRWADRYRGGATSAGGSGLGDATADAIQSAADQLDRMDINYVYGGGHIQPARPNPGLDCSSSVSWVLQHAGLNVPTMDSTALMRWGDSGPGQSITIYANPTHTFMVIGDRTWGTSGFGHVAAGGGPHWFDYPTGASYRAGFVARHPPGM